MSSGKRSRVGSNVVKPIVLAVALTLPGAAAYAASMTDVVTTRSDQNVYEQYGRDSVYAFSTDAKPLKPEQTGPHSNFIGEAFDKTKGFVAGVWDKTTGLFKPHDDGSAPTYTARYEPQPYGRAGGYAGPDRVAVVSGTRSGTYAANDVVKSGQDLGVTETSAYSSAAPLSARANSTVDSRDMAGNRDTMNRSHASRDVNRDRSAENATSAPVVVEDRTTGAPQTEAPAMQDLSNVPSAEPAPPEEQNRSSAASEMRDQGNVTADTHDQSTSTGNVVRSGESAATRNGRSEGDDRPDNAHGQMENEPQTR